MPPPSLATSFFQNQESARRSSRLLIVLLILAVVTVVLALNAVLAVIYVIAVPPSGSWARYGLAVLPQYFFAANTGVVLALIGGGTAVQILVLHSGGEAGARMVGARAIEPGTRETAERRLLNVIEEMALAAGIPAPRAYELDEEGGINAQDRRPGCRRRRRAARPCRDTVAHVPGVLERRLRQRPARLAPPSR